MAWDKIYVHSEGGGNKLGEGEEKNCIRGGDAVAKRL